MVILGFLGLGSRVVGCPKQILKLLDYIVEGLGCRELDLK